MTMATETTTDTPKNSRLGKRPVQLPNGVQVTLNGNVIKAKGPKGELEYEAPASVALEQSDGHLMVSPVAGEKNANQFQGLARAIVNNMVVGVSEGFKTSLDLYGVGYRATVDGQTLTMALGLSHQVVFELPAVVSAKVETIDSAGSKRPRIHLESISKEILGQTAARIKSFRPPEPYKGKGVRFTGERIREKAGKAGKAGK